MIMACLEPKEPALKRPHLQDSFSVPFEVPSLRRSSRHTPSQKPNPNLEPTHAPSPDASSPIVHHPKLVLRLPSDRNRNDVPLQKPNRNLEPNLGPSPEASVVASSPVVHHPKLVLRLPSNRNRNDAGGQDPPPSSSSECNHGEQQTKPWSLPLRRVANYKNMADASAQSAVHVPPQPQPHPDNAARTSLRSSDRGAKLKTRKEEERAMLRVSLSKAEIEEDFLFMTGSMPPQQPKQRPRNVQQKLDQLFPGLYLPETIKPYDYGVRRCH